MGVYAIGDIQGCFDQLMLLLAKVDFDPGKDRLWLAGDLVNRGPDSLKTLDFVRGLGHRAVSVLGNHDLHLLAVAAGTRPLRESDTFTDVLAAPDREDLLRWLRHRPVLHHDPQFNLTMIHGGLVPQWDLSTAVASARELEGVLRGDDYHLFFKEMYGNKPDCWHDSLSGWSRLRFITNVFTRLRYCDEEGGLYLEENGPPGSQGPGCLPWFAVKGRLSREMNIICGHWSTLGPFQGSGVHCLDSGCVWGRSLTALDLEDGMKMISVPC